MAVKTSPLDSVFQTLREIARDTARRLGKDVRLHVAGEIEGWEGSDLSRLQEALVQVLQNAIDHGIEASDAREKIGKSRTGQIWVEFSDGNAESIVTVRDDGAGVDVASVHRKAVGLGLVASPSALAVDETLALLFQPGFSTKKTVTEVSGRGIGLDIVQSVADSFSGKVEIDTTRGKGTTLILRFPRKNRLTAA